MKEIIKRHIPVLHRFYRFLKIKVLFLKKKQYIVFKCNYKWYGEKKCNGFYICPEMLAYKDNEIIVYSAGIGRDISFELDILRDFMNCKIYAFDPTPKSAEWINQQNLPDNFLFFPVGISKETGDEIMYLPKEENRVVGSVFQTKTNSKDENIIVHMKSLEDIVKENVHEYIDILKMDIEGSEFSIIENLNFTKVDCGQIILEFHQRFFKNRKKVLKTAIKKLEENGYFCFAVSKNIEEVYSFINKKYYNEMMEKILALHKK